MENMLEVLRNKGMDPEKVILCLQSTFLSDIMDLSLHCNPTFLSMTVTISGRVFGSIQPHLFK